MAEVDHHDLWQRASLAFVCVAGERPIAEETLVKVKKLLEKFYPEFLLDLRVEFLNF